jgi:hypothetical protein
MRNPSRRDLIVVAMCAATARLAGQQNQPPAPARPDSPAIIEQSISSWEGSLELTRNRCSWPSASVTL